MTISDDVRQGAARLLLYALEAGGSVSEATATFIFLPNFVPIAREDLVGLIAHEPRNLTCVGIRHRETLSVGWWPMAPEDAERHRRTNGEMLSGLERNAGYRGDDAEVVVTGGPDRLIVSDPQFREFMLSYYLPFVDYSVQLGARVTKSASQLVLRFSPAAFPDMEIRGIP